MSHTCPVCFYPHLGSKPYGVWPPPAGLDLRPPYYEQLGSPSYEVCALCAFEFGNDDDPGGGIEGQSFEAYRARWIAEGRPVFMDGKHLAEGFDPDTHGRPPRELPPAD